MIWQNPWAWLGIIGVALPILIHLLGRGHARVIRFPTLRFIDASRLLPTKRSRIQDPLLLAVRVAIVACAALALAQPLLLTSGRRQTLDRGLARAVIVDTSMSVRRAGLDSVRGIARRLAGEAQSSIIVESSDPRSALAGAVAWVAKQQRSGEIAIVSDFQRGQIVREDLARIPETIGIVARRVVVPTNDTVIVRTTTGGRLHVALATTSETGIDAQWRAPTDSLVSVPVRLLAAREDNGAIAAVQSAAATLAIPLPIDTSRAIAVVFPGYAARDSLIRALVPPEASWKLSLLSDARAEGIPVVAAGDAVVDGRRELVLATTAAPASLAAAQLVGLARRATSGAPPANELEPRVLSDTDLKSWERAAATAAAAQRYRPSDENGPSDARWLWAAVLALLLIEWRLRRSLPPAAAIIAKERARAA